MADLLQQAAGWLAGQRRQHLAHPVTYCRPSTGSGQAAEVEVPAMIGKTDVEIEDGYGGIERFESRDFLIAAENLVLDGQAVLPMAGDQIKELIGEQVVVYEVMAPGKQPCWRYSDPYRNTLRIHTKQVCSP